VISVTNNPQAEGIAVAQKAGIPCQIIDPKAYARREVFDAKVVQILEQYQPDLTVLAGFMRILTPVFTDHVSAINLHPSLLPRHKGLHAIEKSYADSYPTGGVSIHWVSSELDGGEILLQKEILKKGLDLDTYHQIIREIEKEALTEAIKIVLSLT